MTEQELVDAIKVGMPPTVPEASRDETAKAMLKKAILKAGRSRSRSWNKEDVTFSLTANKSSYQIGVDILASFADLKKMQYLFRADVLDNPIPIVPVLEFSKYARGSTTVGAPQKATLHSSDETLEIWPIPADAYTMWGYVQKKIENLEDVPSEYHDVLIDLAVASMQARNAKQLANEGMEAINGDSLTEWDDNVIPISRHMGIPEDANDTWSGNLRG